MTSKAEFKLLIKLIDHTEDSTNPVYLDLIKETGLIRCLQSYSKVIEAGNEIPHYPVVCHKF